jgi:uncharacterized membrane protein
MIPIARLASAGWHGRRGWDGPAGPLLLVITLLVVAVAVVVPILVLRARRSIGGVDIVAERYARGEIDETEYRRRVEELRGRSSPSTK